MLFYLSKLIEFILLPSNVIGLLGFLGVLGILIGRRRLGLSLLVFSTILLIIGGWSPLGPAMLTVLENRFPKPNVEGSVDGIIMLGGAVNTHLTSDRGGAALNDAGERLTATVELSRRYRRPASSSPVERAMSPRPNPSRNLPSPAIFSSPWGLRRTGSRWKNARGPPVKMRGKARPPCGRSRTSYGFW